MKRYEAKWKRSNDGRRAVHSNQWTILCNGKPLTNKIGAIRTWRSKEAAEAMIAILILADAEQERRAA